MPIIEARLIRKSKVRHCCESCGRGIPRTDKKLALYGMADVGDKPYWIYFHFGCIKDDVGLHPDNYKMDQVMKLTP